MSDRISYQELLGNHRLFGVAMVTEPMEKDFDGNTERNGIAFNLDGYAYVSWEDPNDGYRSSMGDLQRVSVNQIRMLVEVAGQFQDGIPVEAKIMPDDNSTWGHNNDVLELYDTRNGKLILQVGTTNTNDYYPSAVMRWIPEDIAQ